MKNLFLSICAVCLLINLMLSPSCTHDQEVSSEKLDAISAFSSRDLLISLSSEEQKQAWISRLKSYTDLDLSTDQKSIINDLIFDLNELQKDEFFLSTKIKSDAIAMARITPHEDFINLFCGENLTPNLPGLTKIGSICEECITDIENYVEPPSKVAVSYREAPSCDCNWTCSQQQGNTLCAPGYTPITLPTCSGGSTNNCCSATGGCGLFNLQTCSGKVKCVLTGSEQ